MTTNYITYWKIPLYWFHLPNKQSQRIKKGGLLLLNRRLASSSKAMYADSNNTTKPCTDPRSGNAETALFPMQEFTSTPWVTTSRSAVTIKLIKKNGPYMVTKEKENKRKENKKIQESAPFLPKRTSFLLCIPVFSRDMLFRKAGTAEYRSWNELHIYTKMTTSAKTYRKINRVTSLTIQRH